MNPSPLSLIGGRCTLYLLQVREAHRLELIIIYLIALEIILELAKEISFPGLNLIAWPRRALLFGWRVLVGGRA